MHDDVRRAYAILGLPPGASSGQLRRRYRALVKTWHPDRFASDPVGQAAASERLAHINGAYRLLTEGVLPAQPLDPPVSAPHAEQAARQPHQPYARLSREEIDRMVAAIGTEGPLDSLFGWFDKRRAALQPMTPLKAAGLALVVLLFVVLEHQAGHLKLDLALAGVALVVVLVRSWLGRR